MTLSETIAHINAQGWYVNNLFQTAGRWQCNLRKGDTLTVSGWAKDSTPEAAIMLAFNAARHPAIKQISSSTTNDIPIDLGDL